MRLTKAHVRQLAAEAERVTGRIVLESINSPGDGTTHYVMSESMISVYYGARAACAYLLGVLAGADPAGPAHFTETMPDWVRHINNAFVFDHIKRTALTAHHAGRAYGTTHRAQASEPEQET